MSKPQMNSSHVPGVNTLVTLHFAGVGVSGDLSAKSLARGDVMFASMGNDFLQPRDKQVSLSVLINH